MSGARRLGLLETTIFIVVSLLAYGRAAMPPDDCLYTYQGVRYTHRQQMAGPEDYCPGVVSDHGYCYHNEASCPYQVKQGDSDNAK